MALHPKSKIVALRALLAVTWAEERRLLATINSDETPADEISKALNDLHKLWSQGLRMKNACEDLAHVLVVPSGYFSSSAQAVS
jgi:hypothetical protein